MTAERETKAARTRSAIIDAALTLFRERGYDATTMRAVAAQAGVSVGNAYYYFASKEALVQGFYDRAQVEVMAVARPLLDGERDLAARIAILLEAWLTAMAPYHPFAGKFFKNAAEPTSPLSPFSPESAPARDAAVAFWREVVEGSDARIPKRLRAELPELLWLYHMGIVLLWVYDRSPDVAVTRRVVRHSAPVLVRAIALSRLRVVGGLLDDTLAVLADVRRAFYAAARYEEEP
ncbi:MAG TPA: TetR family transcriptional regulator [Acidimicrobiales bacterium]|nr:TetR family transcriptional regulator [Acidimicrobiales bacterium]